MPPVLKDRLPQPLPLLLIPLPHLPPPLLPPLLPHILPLPHRPLQETPRHRHLHPLLLPPHRPLLRRPGEFGLAVGSCPITQLPSQTEPSFYY